ncbi:TetR/AcrR family transcriptional regulator [Aquihabitans daechungensis]|uniref:TetR/AcrR family transcriptional regulator n=1 Tax=Aquihabitans daechungensis TaxID=1052257 RepID=UPI003BA2A512
MAARAGEIDQRAGASAMGETAAVTGEQQRRRPGRPRDVGADDAIMDAVVEILTEVGFRGLTIDAVAQRAGVGKATIYRRWDGKEQLVLDALAAGRLPVPQPDTGTLRDDLLAYYLPLADAEAQKGAVRLMPALAAEAAVDADLADRLHAFVSDRRAPVAGILQRAQDRGEVNDDVDIELVVDLLTGAIMYRLYFSGAVVDEDVIRRLLEGVLIAIGATDAPDAS